MQNTDQVLVDSQKSEISNASKVRNAALNLLARREHTQLELRQKLARKFPDMEMIDGELQKLVEQNLLSEERFAESFIRMRQRQGKGPKQIAHELGIRGLDENLFGSELSNEKNDWALNAERVYLKKYGAEPITQIEEKMKRHRFLMSRGFTADHVKDLFSKYFKG